MPDSCGENGVNFIQVFCLDLREIKYGDEAPDFPHLHLSTREKVTIIVEHWLGDLQLDPWTRGLSRLLGEMPANNNLLRYPQFRRKKFLLANIQFVKIYSPNRFIVIKDF